MILLYLFRIIVISFFLSIINVNLLNAQNKELSDTECNFPTGKFSKELSDLTSFQSIDIKVNNYKKWVKNSLAILTSDSFRLKKRITNKYKKKFNATITVRYSFGTCVYDAQIRQTGDGTDHISFITDNAYMKNLHYKDEFNNLKYDNKSLEIFFKKTLNKITQSLSIKLKNGNISNIVSFKLLIKETRNSENEILATLLLNKLGFLAPRTRMASVTVNGINHQMLFQENPVKEFLEKNLRREGPMFEGDGTIIFGFYDLNFENRALPSLARLENKKWVENGNNSLKMALRAHSILQNAVMESRNDQNLFSSKKCINFKNCGLTLGNWSIDINSLTKNNDQLREKNHEYIALLLAMGGTHALRLDNRKYYWNAMLDAFEPIYYDGSIDPKIQEPFLIKSDHSFSFYYSEDFLPAVNSLIFKINTLDEKKFITQALELCKSNDCKLNNIKIFLPSIKENLQNYKNKIMDYKDYFTTIEKTNYDINQIIDSYKNELFANLPNSNLYFIDIQSIGNTTIQAIKCNSASCEQDSIEVGDLIYLMKNSISKFDKISLFGGIYNKNDFEVESTYIDILNSNIKHSLGSKIIYNDEKRTLEFHQKKPNDWFLLSDVEISNLSFEMISNSQANKTKLDSQRFNKFGFTGCLNFHNVEFSDTKITTIGGACEDSVNIIKSSGKIKDINIFNASSDALDVDFSNIDIANITITNARNDCFDVSTGKYFVNNAVLKNCGDKGISIGEASEFNGSQINVSDTKIGISSKDSSISNIQSFLGNNIDLCFEAYQKKQEFFGAQLLVETSNCIFDSVFADKNSFVVVERIAQ